jgi:hypothetical protein
MIVARLIFYAIIIVSALSEKGFDISSLASA